MIHIIIISQYLQCLMMMMRLSGLQYIHTWNGCTHIYRAVVWSSPSIHVIPFDRWTHLVVHLQRVSFSLGLEVLCVGVHREVNLLVEALHVHRVPVLVVQQAAHSDSNAAAAESQPAVVWGETQRQQLSTRSSFLHFPQWRCEAVRADRQSWEAKQTHVHTHTQHNYAVIF